MFSKIEKTNFIVYLNRTYNLLTLEVHAHSYGNKLFGLTGFKFKKMGYLSDGKVVNILRTKKELEAMLKRLNFLTKNYPEKISKILDRGKYFNQKMSKELSQKVKYLNSLKKMENKQLAKEFEKKYNLFSEQFAYTTAIPFRLGLVLGNNDRFYKKVEELRKVSFYEKFGKEIIGGILKEIARRINLKDYSLLFSFFSFEILNFLSKQKNFLRSEYKKRLYFSYFSIDDKIYFQTGKKVYLKYKKLFCEKIIKPNKIIKGQCAFPGKVKNTVRICQDEKAKLNKGEIAVSINANPKYLPILRKAGAIITDEGGAMCHASIISREFKIPCIVGTKFATKVFKDGDMVEVDAEKGIVRKI